MCTYLPVDKVLDLLHQSATGYLAKDAEFFKAGDKILQHHNRRQGVISVRKDDPDSDDSGDTPVMTFCNVPGCNKKFASVPEFESHYNSLHRYNCSQCKKNLPSAHLLDLHLEENHDSYFEMLAQKKASYRCFIEECPVRFWSPTERLDHGIKTHKLPSNFRFATKEKKPKDVAGVEKMDDDQPKAAQEAKVVLKSTMIKQKPITFGHNVPRSFDSGYVKALTRNEGNVKKTTNTNPLEDSKMLVDLLDSLPK